MNRHEATSTLYRLIEIIGAPSYGFDVTSAAANEIRLAGKALRRIGESERNVVIVPDGSAKLDESDQNKADRQREKQERRVIQALASAFASNSLPLLDVEFQSDQRGAPVIIHTKGRQDRLAVFY